MTNEFKKRAKDFREDVAALEAKHNLEIICNDYWICISDKKNEDNLMMWNEDG